MKTPPGLQRSVDVAVDRAFDRHVLHVVQGDAGDNRIARRQRVAERAFDITDALAKARAAAAGDGEHRGVGIPDLHLGQRQRVGHRLGQRSGAATEVEHHAATVGGNQLFQQGHVRRPHRGIAGHQLPDELVVVAGR
ncbi:MAG: hypothetical protein QM775_25250 [Pirellulales bacterium]